VGVRSLSPAEVLTQIKDVLRQPYKGRDVDKFGMTLLEAALYAAAKKAADGDIDALDKVLNRLVGKPLQTVVSASGTLSEFLDRVANDKAVIDVDATPAPAQDVRDL